jgi:predicted lysophospholipase L1 biosynthesis ABC-type transport system permease subunit
MTLLLFFLMGLVQDFLIAKYYLALSRRSAIVASILGMAITYLTMKVFNVTFGRDAAFLAYALGTGFGTYAGCKHGRR